MSRDDSKSERTPPWEQESERESASFGLWLRRQREMREVPLREIADVTKISLRYLEALEQDRFDVLPAPVFARGFLREYSRYVGLDADEVVNSFLIATGEVVQTAEEEGDEDGEGTGSNAGGSRTTLFVILALMVIVAVVVVVALVARAREEQPVRSSPIAAPVPELESPAVSEPLPTASSMPLTVILDFTEDCWVEAVVDEDRTISELRVQGESMRLEGEREVLLTLGNPGGVRVEVNGRPYDFSYGQSQVVRSLEIDLELAESLASGDN